MVKSTERVKSEDESMFQSPSPLNQHGPTGINILVIGAGVAGLYFAMECARQGHQPVIYEAKNEDAQPDGDFFMIGPSATYVLDYWPEFQKAYKSYAQDTWVKFYRHDGADVFGPIPAPEVSGKVLIRKQMHEMMIAEVKRLKIPIFYGDRAVRYFETDRKGGVEFASGKVLEADLVAACDGVHSRSWQLVVGTKEEPISSGYSVFRCAMPMERALANAQVKEKFGRKADSDGNVHDSIEFLLGPNTHTVMTFGKGVTCWATIYEDFKSDAHSSESWSSSMQPAEVLEVLHKTVGWDPIFQELIKLSPPIVDWRLMLRNPQSKWVSDGGRVVQVGDSAHPFLPTSANGATQAMEDAVSLATCLRLGGNPERIPIACRVHNKLRFDRVSCVQLQGLYNRESFHKTDWEAVKKDPSILARSRNAWVAKHNAEEYAINNFQACSMSLNRGSASAFENTNTPPGYDCKPWDLRTILRDAEEGRLLKLEGDWT